MTIIVILFVAAYLVFAMAIGLTLKRGVQSEYPFTDPE
jgi:hypothetical protein